MSNKKKLVLPHVKSANDFQETTDILIKDLLREHGLPASFIATNAFREFIRHLNPLASFTLIDDQKPPPPPQPVPTLTDFLPANNSEFSVDAKMMLRQPLPTSLRLDPPCIICSAPITTSKARLLNLNETAKILMAAVLTKNVKIENAAQSICNHPLRMCSSHSRPAYEMMVNVIGARTADEVDRAKVERMLPGLELYKVLRSIRTTIENKPIAMTPMGSFKMALKKFYKGYTPKDVLEAVMQEKKRVLHVNNTLQKNPADLHVRSYLTNQSIQIRRGEEMNLLDAIKLRDHPHFVPPNMVHGTSGAPVQEQDLLYNTITERRTSHREKRYDSYPEEIRKLMEPIDAQYDKQTAECRALMKNIRKHKASAIDNVVVPIKLPAQEPVALGPRKRQPPTRYQDLVAQKLKEAAEKQGSVHQPDEPVTSNKAIHPAINRAPPSHGSPAQNTNQAVEKKPEGLGGLMQDMPSTEKKPEGLGSLMQKQPPTEKKPKGLGNLMQKNPPTEKKPEGLGNLMQAKPTSEKKPQPGDMLVPKEEPLDNYGDEFYDKIMTLQKQEEPVEEHDTYNPEEHVDEIDMYSHDTPRKVVRLGNKYC